MIRTTLVITFLLISFFSQAQNEEIVLPIFKSDLTLTQDFDPIYPWIHQGLFIQTYLHESYPNKIRLTHFRLSTGADIDKNFLVGSHRIVDYDESINSFQEIEANQYWQMPSGIIPEREDIEIIPNPIPEDEATRRNKKWKSSYLLSIADNTFFLEGEFLTQYVWLGETTTSHYIRELYISPNFQFLTGFLYKSITNPTIEGPHIELSRQPLIWNAITGKKYFPNENTSSPLFEEKRTFFEPRDLEIRFSPDSRFCKYRLIVGKFQHHPENYWFFPKAALVDLKYMRSLEADKDVAFSPDGTRFVTVRNEIPTLVDSETDQNLAHFAISSPMVSATFSSDGEHLYIATEENIIERFTASFSTVYVSHWELH